VINMNRVMKKGLLLVCILAQGMILVAQDFHYADVQTMNLWYNPALKTNREGDLRINYKDIKYKSLSAFSNGHAMVSLPLVKKDKDGVLNKKGFLSATAAGAFDKSNQGAFRHTTAMLGLSYAQQLTADKIFMALGFQGSTTSARFGGVSGLFPDQFDAYGPLSVVTQDPLQGIRRLQWVSFHTGLSLFQQGEQRDWYLGASARHLNNPFTDEQKTADYRLPTQFSVQGGLTVKNEWHQFGVYGLVNWKAEASEYLMGARFGRTIDPPVDDHEGTSLYFGLGFRLRDAIIPNLQMKFNKTIVGFHYDINISGLRAAGYTRQGFELVVSRKLYR
jgi:type IX secretion system PorP/SprF family membrane protein